MHVQNKTNLEELLMNLYSIADGIILKSKGLDFDIRIIFNDLTDISILTSRYDLLFLPTGY